MNGRRLLLGLWLLARFRSEGLAQFGRRAQDVLNSLAPLLAFPAVFAAIAAIGGSGRDALAGLLAVVIGVLSPLVLSEALARRWSRDADWPRYAVASNWCQWLTPAAGIVLVLALSLLAQLGLPEAAAPRLAVALLLGYIATVQWFLARRGLDLSAPKAVLFVVLTNAGTAALIAGPQILRQAMAGAA